MLIHIHIRLFVILTLVTSSAHPMLCVDQLVHNSAGSDEVSLARILSQLIDAPLAGMDPSHRQELDTAFLENRNQSLNENFKTFWRLAIWFSQGDPHARRLEKWGWRLQLLAGRVALVPPDEIEIFFKCFYRDVLENLKSGRISEDNVILPALLYSNRFLSYTIRPGIDAWPPANHSLVTLALPPNHAAFYLSVRKGHFYLIPRMYWVHDMAHLTELIDHPEVMEYWRHFARRRSLKHALIRGDIFLEGLGRAGFALRGLLKHRSGRSADFETRSAILAEYFSLPNQNALSLLSRLDPKLSETADLSTLRIRLATLPEASRQAEVEQFIISMEPSLTRHGGTMRDGYNDLFHYAFINQLEKFASLVVNPGSPLQIKSRLTNFTRYIIDRFQFPADYNNPDFPNLTLAYQESLHGMLKDLKALYQLRYRLWAFRTQVKAYPPDEATKIAGAELDTLFDRIANVPEPKRNVVLDELIIDILSRLQMAILKAHELEIDIETIHREARLSPPPVQSRTFRYLKSYLPEKSLSHRAFKLGRK